jgi:D-glycero-alpha-D-manno-heptose-7-phosphate kinase
MFVVLIGRSPLRISFSGGGTDLEEYHKKFDGYTISYAINRYTYVIAKLRDDNLLQGFSPDFASHLPPNKYHKSYSLPGHEIVLTSLKEMNFKKGIDIFLSSEVKPNSGLGASSSLTANLVNVILKLQKKKWNRNKIAMKAYFIGHDVLKWGIGKQDEFASVFGGLNLLKYTKDKVSVRKISLNNSTQKELQKNSLLFHIGGRQHSENILKSQINNITSSNKQTLDALHLAKRYTLEMYDALKANDLEQFSIIINNGWEAKKKFVKGMTNPRIEKISKIAMKCGAKSLKVTGAGGGGHIFLYADTSKHKKIESALKKLDVSKVDFKYENLGANVFDIRSFN